MKDKILLFIIGILLGAIIATGAFFVYSNCSNSTSNQNTSMPGGTPPSMPNGQSGENGQPPEKPSDDNNESTNIQNN